MVCPPRRLPRRPRGGVVRAPTASWLTELFLMRVEAAGTIADWWSDQRRAIGRGVTSTARTHRRGEDRTCSRDVASGQQRRAARDGQAVTILRQLDRAAGSRDEAPSGRAGPRSSRGCQPCLGRPPGAEHRDDQISGGVAVDPPPGSVRRRGQRGPGLLGTASRNAELAVPSRSTGSHELPSLGTTLVRVVPASTPAGPTPRIRGPGSRSGCPHRQGRPRAGLRCSGSARPWH